MIEQLSATNAVKLIEESTGKRILNQQELERLKRAEETERKRLQIEEQLARARAQALIPTN